MLGLSASLSKASVTLLSFIKDNLKLFFDFKNTDLEHVGTGSVYFDGSNDKVDFTSSKDLTADFTIAFWIKTQDSSNTFYLNNSAAVGEDYINFYGGTFNVEANNDLVALSSGWSESHVWKHVAITRLGAIWTLYVNGVSSYFATDNTETFTYDRMGTDGSDFGQFYTKNLGIWERALSASEIQNIVYKTYDDLQGTEKTHLYAWYALDSSTDTYNDSHGTNHGTNGGSTLKDGVYADYSPRKPRGVDNSSAALADQIGNGSANFDASEEDKIQCGGALVNAYPFSIIGWVKPVAGSNLQVLTLSDISASSVYFSLSYNGASDNAFQLQARNTTLRKINSATYSTVSGWYHLAGIFSSATDRTLYVNGIKDHSGAEALDSVTFSSDIDTTTIGALDRPTPAYGEGNVAQVGLWSRALSQEEVQEISQKQYSELTTSEKGSLTSWWGLDAVYQGEWNPHSSGSGMLVDDLAGTETLGSNLVSDATWANANSESQPFETFTTSGNQIIQASNTTGHGTCATSTFSLEVNAFYKLSFNLGYTADDADNDPISVVGVGVGTTLGSAPRPFQITSHTTTGSQTYYFKVPSSRSDYRFGFQAGNNKVLTITLSDLSIQKVTGKNFGTLE